MVTARTARLERCLAELLAAPAPTALAAAESGQPPQGGQPLRAAPAFLAFLQPRPAAAAAAKPAWKSPLRESPAHACLRAVLLSKHIHTGHCGFYTIEEVSTHMVMGSVGL